MRNSANISNRQNRTVIADENNGDGKVVFNNLVLKYTNFIL